MMHQNILKNLSIWYRNYGNELSNNKIAELGSYNINGSIKTIIPNSIGFDIIEHESVDIVIKPGIISDDQKHKYKAVISTGSFQCCDDSQKYKNEIIDLLMPNGLLFLTMCGPNCRKSHQTTQNKYNFKDSVRMKKCELIEFFDPEIECIKCWTEVIDGHEDMIFYGIKKEPCAIQVFKPILETSKILDSLKNVLESGWIGLGPKTKEFEDKLAEYIGCKYFVALNSCTAALHLAIQSLNLPKRSKVLTTPITFVSTNHAILYNELEPVFCDVERTTGNIDAVQIQNACENYDIKAIIVVHIGGYSADMESINKIAKNFNIPVIEDCAHAFGAIYKGRKVGNTDNICCWSFQAVKNLPIGDGGAISTNNKELYDNLMKMRWLGIDKDTVQRSSDSAYKWQYDVPMLGYKYHLNDISSAIGIVGLETIDKNNEIRYNIAKYYMDNINNYIYPSYESDRISSYHFIPLFFGNRDKIYNRLTEDKIYSTCHYKRNDQYKLYEKYIKINDCINAEWYQNHVLVLPIHLGLIKSDLKRIVNVINKEE